MHPPPSTTRPVALRKRSYFAALTCGVALSTALVAQIKPSSKPSRIGDQLVRHFLETNALELPIVGSGDPIDAGTGRLALLARRADGTLDVRELERRTNPGADVTPPVAHHPEEILEEEEIAEEVVFHDDEIVELEEEIGDEEEVAEEEVVEEDVVKEEGAGESEPAIEAEVVLDELVVESSAIDETVEVDSGTESTRYTEIRLSLDDGQVHVHLGDESLGRWADVDRKAFVRRIAALEKPRLETAVIAPHPRVPWGPIMAVAAAAREAGATINFAGGTAAKLSLDDLATIKALPERLGWTANERGLYDAELLLLIDQHQPWTDVQALVLGCVSIRTWRIAFVGADASGRRVKLPTPVAVDAHYVAPVDDRRD